MKLSKNDQIVIYVVYTYLKANYYDKHEIQDGLKQYPELLAKKAFNLVLDKHEKEYKKAEELDSFIPYIRLIASDIYYKKVRITPPSQTQKDKAFYNSEQWQEFRKHIFKACKKECMICGIKTGKLCADHILPRKLYPEHTFDFWNSGILCDVCNQATSNNVYKLKQAPEDYRSEEVKRQMEAYVEAHGDPSFEYDPKTLC